MPIRALRPDGVSVQSLDCDETGWASVRDAIRRDAAGWRLPCCESRVVAKRSKRGTPFFAHYARGACEWAPETEHHLRLKALAVEAARNNGWHAETEVSGRTPEGEAWKADVLATRGETRVAIEVQWSSHTDDELQARQARYARAGVRAMWLIRTPGFPVCAELPAVCVREDGFGRYTTHLPARSGARLRNQRDWQYRDIPAAALLDAAFAGRLRWNLRMGEPISWTVNVATVACWRCKRDTTPVVDVVVGASGAESVFEVENFKGCESLLHELLPIAVMQKHRIGAIRPRFSKTEGCAYLSNGCFHCGALQGRFFRHRYMDEAEPCHRGEDLVDERWKALLGPRLGTRWRLLGVRPTRWIKPEEDED